MLRRERQGEGYASLGELGDAYPGAKADLEVGGWVGGWGWGWGGLGGWVLPACHPQAAPTLCRPPLSAATSASAAAALLQALKADGLVLSLPAADTSRREMYYPVDQRLHLRVDPDLQELWLSVGAGLPEEDDELAAELRKIGEAAAAEQPAVAACSLPAGATALSFLLTRGLPAYRRPPTADCSPQACSPRRGARWSGVRRARRSARPARRGASPR